MGSAFYISVDDDGRREHPLGYGHDAKGLVKNRLCRVYSVWRLGFMVIDGAKGVPGLFSDPAGPAHVLHPCEHPGDEETMSRVCQSAVALRVRTANKSQRRGTKALVSCLLGAPPPL